MIRRLDAGGARSLVNEFDKVKVFFHTSFQQVSIADGQRLSAEFAVKEVSQ